jgi:hypothetical protein
MRKKNSLLVAIPLGVGLLVFGSLSFEPPGAVKRPAPSFSLFVNDQPVAIDREVDVKDVLVTIEFEPAKALFLETVVLQGTVGDKKAAIRELRKIGDSDSIAVLSTALADEDPRVRKAAFEALSRIGGDEALAAIASATASNTPQTKARAVETLANAGGYSAVDYLELALRDDDVLVRAAAVDALGDIGDSRSVNIISAALRDPDPEVRERAVEMLDELNDDALFHALNPPR